MNTLGILFLTVLIEGTISFLAGENKNGEPRTYLKYLGLAAGMGLAVAYNVDLPGMVGLSTSMPIINYLLSGIVIGRGSNYVNDIIKFISGRNEQ